MELFEGTGNLTKKEIFKLFTYFIKLLMLSVIITFSLYLIDKNIKWLGFFGGFLGTIISVITVYWSTTKPIKHLNQEKQNAKNTSYKMILTVLKRKEMEIEQLIEGNVALYSWAPISNDIEIKLLSDKSYDRIISAISSLRDEAVYPMIVEILEMIEMLSELITHQREKSKDKEKIIKKMCDHSNEVMLDNDSLEKIDKEVDKILDEVLSLKPQTLKIILFIFFTNINFNSGSIQWAEEKINQAVQNIKKEKNITEENIYMALQNAMFYSIFSKVASIENYQIYYYFYILMGNVVSQNPEGGDIVLKFERLRNSILTMNFYEEIDLKVLLKKLKNIIKHIEKKNK